MAAPAVVQSRTTTLKTTSGNINYPAGMITGNLVVFIVGWADDASPVDPTGSNLTFVGEQDNASNNRASVAVWYREIDGTEGSSEAFTFGADRECTAHVVEISGWDTAEAPLAAFATTLGSRTANPDPPSRSWTWSGDTLALAGFVFRDDATVSSNPSGYTTVDSGANSGKALNHVAEKDVTTSPEDPGTFSCSTDKETTTYTIVIKAAAAGGHTRVRYRIE